MNKNDANRVTNALLGRAKFLPDPPPDLRAGFADRVVAAHFRRQSDGGLTVAQWCLRWSALTLLAAIVGASALARWSPLPDADEAITSLAAPLELPLMP